jgi:hypothetical protein
MDYAAQTRTSPINCLSVAGGRTKAPASRSAKVSGVVRKSSRSMMNRQRLAAPADLGLVIASAEADSFASDISVHPRLSLLILAITMKPSRALMPRGDSRRARGGSLHRRWNSCDTSNRRGIHRRIVWCSDGRETQRIWRSQPRSQSSPQPDRMLVRNPTARTGTTMATECFDRVLHHRPDVAGGVSGSIQSLPARSGQSTVIDRFL